MIVKCPVCQTEYDLEPGTYQCECGAKFIVEGPNAEAEVEANLPAEDDLNKTIAPRRHVDYDPAYDRTMPGKRDRKPDGYFEPGELILNRYKVLGSLGRGGMGVVYKCFDEVGGIEIALKALPPELSHDEEEMEDIKANFQIISKLVHQNICISKNLEKDSSNGNYYLIMECVEGEDLRRWIRQKRTEGPLTPDDILPVVRQIAEALDYAHGEGIIHRDIKPGNVMIDQHGRIKILDFGLAAQIHSSMSRVSMAYHGTSGTATYMAPEQWRGQAQRAAADQYALAAMTYEMLAGRLPFEVSDTTLLREAVLNELPQPIEYLPKHVQNALLKALSKKPEDRFSCCSEFVDALEGQGSHGANRKSGKGMWVALAVVIVLAVIGIGYGCHQSAKAQRIAEEQRIAAERRQKAEEQRLAEEQRITAERQRKAEEQRIAAERQRKAEEQRIAEEKRQRDQRIRAEQQAKRDAELAAARRARDNSVSTVSNSTDDPYHFNSLVFYAPLEQEMSQLSTGQAITTHGNVSYTEVDGIKCAYFDGKSMLSFGKNNILGNSPCTMCIWVYSTSNDRGRETAFAIGRQEPLSKRALIRHGGQLKFEAFNGSAYSRSILSNQWNFIACIYDGRNCRIFINGRFTGEAYLRLDTQADHIKIGALCDVNESWKGYLSHARIYNKCLSPQEITQLASELKPNKNMTSTPRTESRDQNFPATIQLPNGTEIEMVKIKAGTFMMGSPVTEHGRSTDETQHKVRLTKDYWIGKYPVTQQQYSAVMGNHRSETYGLKHPVELVGWAAAMQFCDRLNKITEGMRPPNYIFSLPSEAQWEYACRAGSITAFPWGNDANIFYKYGNYCDLSCYKAWKDHSHNDGYRKTSPVGIYLPNRWGLYDMLGNVFELCSDWYGAYPNHDVTDPVGPPSGERRVRRGGSWLSRQDACRSASRSQSVNLGISSRGGDEGFRVALIYAPVMSANGSSSFPATLSMAKEITVQGDNEIAWYPGKFTPPYTIRAKCKTNRYNIRFELLNGEIIFNWECDPHDLRLDIPGISSPRNSKGNGFVGINTYANIEVKVFPTSFFVYVNEKLRYRGSGNWQNVESRIGIRTAIGHPRRRYNNIATIKEFSVEPGG